MSVEISYPPASTYFGRPPSFFDNQPQAVAAEGPVTVLVKLNVASSTDSDGRHIGNGGRDGCTVISADLENGDAG